MIEDVAESIQHATKTQIGKGTFARLLEGRGFISTGLIGSLKHINPILQGGGQIDPPWLIMVR